MRQLEAIVLVCEAGAPAEDIEACALLLKAKDIFVGGGNVVEALLKSKAGEGPPDPRIVDLRRQK